MPDEIAQYTQIELESTKILIKGGVEVAKFMARALKAIIHSRESLSEFWNKQRDITADKHTRRKNELSMKDMMHFCDGEASQILMVREDDLEKTLKAGEAKGLHYTRGVDFNPHDGLVPIVVSPKEMAIWGQIYKAVSSEHLEIDKEAVKGYDTDLSELNERLDKLKPEYDELSAKIDALNQAKEDRKKWVEYGEKIQHSSNDELFNSLSEYIYQCKGTDFEKNPEVAMAELEKGVEIGPKISAKEILKPIRDKNAVPKSKIMFYLPDVGVMITREFHIDEKTNLAYSNFSFKNEKGEQFNFSDRNLSNDKWEKIEKEIYEKAGIMENTMCRAFDNKEKLNRFLTYHNKIKSPAKENIEAAIKEKGEAFSNAEVKKEILNATDKEKKGITSAEIKEKQVSFICSPDMFIAREGKPTFNISEDAKIQFNGELPKVKLQKDGSLKMIVTDKNKPVLITVDGKKQPVDLKQLKQHIDFMGKAANSIHKDMKVTR